MRGTPSNATHTVNAFNHRGERIYGTWHIGDSSMSIEVSAWKARMQRGDDILKVVVTDLRNGTSKTIYPETQP